MIVWNALRRAQRACEGAARGTGAPASDPPSPRLWRVHRSFSGGGPSQGPGRSPGLNGYFQRLERLWNQLANSEAFSLPCGYAMGNLQAFTPA